jgi:hypothetical protein
MVLTQDIKRKLLELIVAAPCSIQELALELGRNWRTVDGYVSKLQEEGLVSVKGFKRGPRVAFKIVYIQPDINYQASNIQKKLLRQIESGKRSQDFSPLNIVQYLPETVVTAYFKSSKLSTEKVTEDLSLFLNKATTSLLMFSGDLSWVDLKSKKESILDTIESLAREKVVIKIIARVDRETKARIEKLMNINHRLGHDWIEIRHEERPLRCFIVDGKLVRLKEPAFAPAKAGLKKAGTYFYQIHDASWVGWLERVFWSMFRSSIPADKRLQVLDKIEELKN